MKKRYLFHFAASFLLLLASAFLDRALANTYNVTSTSDFPISGAGISVNNANGVITGSAGNGFVILRSAIAAAIDCTMKGNAISSSWQSVPHENRMPLLAVSYIISLFGVYPLQN